MMNQEYGYGGMVTIDVGTLEIANKLMEKMQDKNLGYLAVSLGFYKTLFCAPGRGCLAGPVTAAAVILKPDFYHKLIDDSKKLSMTDREKLSKIIIQNSISFSIQNVFPNKIDKVNILNASILAMHKCINNLSVKPEFLIIDGNKFKKYKDIPHETVIKGDG